jgi:hypothetical protein
MAGFGITVAVTKLHASRSQQNHTTLQHKQVKKAQNSQRSKAGNAALFT